MTKVRRVVHIAGINAISPTRISGRPPLASYPVTAGGGGFGGLGFGLGFALGFGFGGVGTLGPTSGLPPGVALTVTVSALSPQAVGPAGVFMASPE
jgi:hypothetical protein